MFVFVKDVDLCLLYNIVFFYDGGCFGGVFFGYLVEKFIVVNIFFFVEVNIEFDELSRWLRWCGSLVGYVVEFLGGISDIVRMRVS